MKITLVTSAFNPTDYVDQYCRGLATWKDSGFVRHVRLVFCSVAAGPLSESLRGIAAAEEKVARVGEEVGLDVLLTRAAAEPYPRTINRCLWDYVATPFVGILNLDDWRDIAGVERQVAVLEAGSALTYGDFLVVTDMGVVFGEGGEAVQVPTYDIERGRPARDYQAAFRWGPFLAWRRDLNDRIGYYDEQLTVVADFDWVDRVLEAGYPVAKTPGLLGAFLGVGRGLSTVPDTRGHAENPIVSQRFLDGLHPHVLNFGTPVRWRALVGRAVGR